MCTQKIKCSHTHKPVFAHPEHTFVKQMHRLQNTYVFIQYRLKLTYTHTHKQRERREGAREGGRERGS